MVLQLLGMAKHHALLPPVAEHAADPLEGQVLDRGRGQEEVQEWSGGPLVRRWRLRLQGDPHLLDALLRAVPAKPVLRLQQVLGILHRVAQGQQRELAVQLHYEPVERHPTGARPAQGTLSGEGPRDAQSAESQDRPAGRPRHFPSPQGGIKVPQEGDE